MNWLPDTNQLDFFGRGASAALIQSGMLQFLHFTLVVFRLSGLMLSAPGFSHSSIPLQIRILLITTISLLLTPNLGQLSREGFRQLDINHDEILQVEEIPQVLIPRVEAIKIAQGLPSTPLSSLSLNEYSLVTEFPNTLVDYLWIVIGELGLGIILGLGVMTILAALQLAGQMIDQQTGSSLGELFNPELNSSVSVSGEMIYQLGVTVFLALGGHVLLLDSLMNTFRTFPPGQGFLSDDAINLFSDLVHQSLIIALQVSAPIMATMSILTLAMGFLGHTVPQINILVFGFPIKVMAGTFVICLSLSGMGETVANSVPDAVDALRSTLSGLETNKPPGETPH